MDWVVDLVKENRRRRTGQPMIDALVINYEQKFC
jgi:hypothetical protein